MGHGGGAKARLVGEHAPGKSLAHSHHNGIAEYAAPTASKLKALVKMEARAAGTWSIRSRITASPAPM